MRGEAFLDTAPTAWMSVHLVMLDKGSVPISWYAASIAVRFWWFTFPGLSVTLGARRNGQSSRLSTAEMCHSHTLMATV